MKLLLAVVLLSVCLGYAFGGRLHRLESIRPRWWGLVILGLGIVLLVCVILYLIPRTSVLGAILLTGYLGGAVASHVRVGDPLFTHTLFPVFFAVLPWGGLYVRDPQLRALIPLRRAHEELSRGREGADANSHIGS